MRNQFTFWVYLLLILGITASCSTRFRRIEKNPDWRVRYEAAQNYYNKKDYYKAGALYEQIMPIVRGLPEGEKVQFYLAYCQYYNKMYLLASEHFKTFYQTYGRSALVEEARFMFAHSLYVSSPNAHLDQNNSIQAMAAMQEFLNRYPQSKFAEQALEAIRTTQEKLERKGFDNARQYYRMRYYQAAILSLENFKRNFPDSKFQEEAQYLIVVSQYKLAQQSIYSKQEERYKEVVEFYKELVDKFPSSTYLRDAEKLYTESLLQLTKFKGNI